MKERAYSPGWKWMGLIGGVLLVGLLMVVSVSVGIMRVPFDVVIDSFTHFNGSNQHLIIQTTRVPRTLIAVMTGGSLAIAGAMMQALTRNPLASPATLGVNAGASLFIVIGVSFWGMTGISSLVSLGFVGAAIASFAVYFLGSAGRGGLTPIKLTLAGSAIWALFSSLTQGLLIMNEKGLEELLFWLTGSVEGRSLALAMPVFPFMVAGFILAFLLSRAVNILMMGDDVAVGLGVKTGLIKLMGSVVIVLLAGGAVAVAGPIVFVGLVVPHMVRWAVGTDHRWVFPYCLVYGAAMLLVADISGRLIMNQQEIPVGVMTALIGTPFFIYLAMRNRGERA
ncbi:FecCD family ABC transporter permease [Laceyella sacchari]|uniref:Iron ABC transporter permease n=1 Tax=Laceyella sacchari TaxID=37482 RepID=A0ABY5U3B0_LACSH|nr:iron ABC transporter permease [Laceyella sacchari]UWE04123.1 iron ABC transporter permease [Laceyella sacchari]